MYNDNISGEQKLLAMAAHITYFLGGLGFIIAPLAIYIFKKDDVFVREHAKQALAAHIFMFVLSAVASTFWYIIIGFLLLPSAISSFLQTVLSILLTPLVIIISAIFIITSILGAIKAAEGKMYYYPVIQRFINKF